MKARSVTVGSERTFVAVLDQGEEAFRAITDFAKERVSGAAAIGAFVDGEGAYFWTW
jgi:predicted DNA-binding protein with PD1-like motif